VKIETKTPALDHDEMIGHMETQNREDQSRGLIAKENREQVKEFLDATGMNGTAYSWCRTILKKQDTQKAMDIILSLEAALPHVRAHVTGQQPDMFDERPGEMPDDAVEPFMGELPKPSYDASFNLDDDK
jgi:hypothetical protein